ncbi:MAG: acyl-[ACP]--phospholipid O-acyltransferase [Alphaproteobacteria bacterium]|nr:acyl-[ACP]--phospholipid O-acyltransferase [Alphaproteobacteria bacterium]
MAPHSGFFTLLTQRRFAPLFYTQFLGAFVDNVFRNALIILVTYNETLAQGYDRHLTVTLLGGLVVLPFFLFSSLAGQLADRYEKSKLVMFYKAIEIIVMALGIYALLSQSLLLLLLIFFLNMTQAAFFGPIKYSILPLYLKKGELLHGNAMIESSTFLAILLGSIMGGIAVSIPNYGIYIISTILLLSSIAAFVSCCYLPKANAADPHLKINLNLLTTSFTLIRLTAQNRTLFLSIIGISWFWVVGGIFLTQISIYGKEVLGGNQSLASLFLILFTIGIGLGSFLCTHLSKGKIDSRHIIWGALGMTLFIVDLVIASHFVSLNEPDYIGINQFLFHSNTLFNNWRITLDLMMIAVCGGLYTVPLYTLLQVESDTKVRSRVIAANNIMNSFFMVVSTLITMILVSFKIPIPHIFLITGLVNLIVIGRIARLVPESVVQLFFHGLLKFLFRVEIKGLQNYHNSGKRTLIIANHTSFLDGLLIFAFIPERLNFAIYSHYINKWWIRIMRGSINLFPLDPTNPLATKHLIDFLRQDRKCVIFPEGRITVTGSLMKIYDGPGMVADRAEATILPIRIEGAQYSFFSHLRGVVRRKFLPQITLTILPSQIISAPKNLKGKERRKIMSSKLYDIMVGMIFETSPYERTLFSTFIEAAKTHGMRRIIVEDSQRDPLTYRQVLMRSYILGHYLENRTVPGERVSILLPTSIATLISFFALHSIGRVPAMLNFSLGLQNLQEACNLARTRLVITSRRFIEIAHLEDIVEKLSQHVQILYLEDVRTDIGLFAKIRGLIAAHFPEFFHRFLYHTIKPDDPAVILFTSGSEGTPKAVVLSHTNINANRFQVTSTIDFNAQDIVLNVLPMFHSFGLMGGTLIPLFQGIRAFYYPSPLHYRMVPVTAYDINATIFFATDTFLSRYARLAHPYDFYATRYVFAGAEKLQPETRQVWIERFGIQILEAYGTTETSPALSMNTRMYNKIGTVGRFLPAIQHRLRPVEGISQGGQLLVKGPNIMLGYINHDTSRIIPPRSDFEENNHSSSTGWYDTGDIVSVDEQGFVTILGRVKRFAKIGGEMISLVYIEEIINTFWPESQHVLLAFPDPRKGEKLVLLTTGSLSREEITTHLKSQGLTELNFPRHVFYTDQIPLLATGKVDFPQAKILAENFMARDSQIG